MTIEKGYLTVGPTVTRGDAKAFAAAIVPASPPSSYVRPIPNSGGQAEIIEQPAEREGQIVFFRDQGSSLLQAYVVVSVDTVLVWKPVVSSIGTINSNTGQPYDPLAGFYNPLAS